MKNYLFLLLACSLIFGCNPKSKQDTLLQLIPASASGIDFNNEIPENDTLNILKREFMYNGGGVAIGDFNSDGLADIYFSGNLKSNALYLNKDNFEFEEVGEIAGVNAPDIWSSGVAVVDINNDDRLDIYVSATFNRDLKGRTNQLFINQGNNDEGIPQFEEQAAAYGLADTSHTTQAYFFDYDKDGDLDVFLLNDKLFRPRSTTDLNLLMKGGEETVDKLLKNDGNGQFNDVSVEAGIKLPGFGLGAALLDVNQDGWTDIYVSNDFISNDILYVNQQDGTFKNEVASYFKHHSFSSMGVDATDLNGDGVAEVMTLDMLPEDPARVKRTYPFQKYKFYDLMESTGYTMQYNRNMLQLSDGQGRYRDVSELAGVDATEWSWSVLFADFDNDALQDIAITNGYPRDLTDMDFSDFRSSVNMVVATEEKLLAQIPRVKVKNYFYKNEGQLQFKNKSKEWGIELETFSNGAASVDLDNDGDLDYVVNNINDLAHVYENRSNEQLENNYLKIQLIGDVNNKMAIGAKVQVFIADKELLAYNFLQRGYISSISPTLHFGLGQAEKVDSIIIRWSGDQSTILKNVNPNQLLKVEKAKAEKVDLKPADAALSLFEVVENTDLDFKHEEIKFYDFNFQLLLPRLHSREGPGIAVGDLNGDGVEDFAFGNGSRHDTHIYLSKDNGSYDKQLLTDTRLSEDMGLLMFDADQDGDLDLYVSSGSTEFRIGSQYFQDKLYINDGRGSLSLSQDALPQLTISSASVSAADYDKDGDLDLFLSGRIKAQSYPEATSSYLLKNDQGKFSIVNETSASILENIGMVTQGLWTDFNQDGWLDLILVGEWMPIKFLENQKGNLKENEKLKMATSSGWWNSITGADLDNDGDVDYVLGNQGLNNKNNPSAEHPLRIYAYDFDQNGSIDPIIAAWQGDAYYPVHLKMDLSNQLTSLKKKFLKYRDYSVARMEDLFPKDTLNKAPKYEAHTFASAILWNKESGFELEALPVEAQLAPVYGSLCKDVNLDGYQDIILLGNRYNTEVFEGRHDAMNGLVLINQGDGHFKKAVTGFVVDQDARTLVAYFDQNDEAFLVAGINNAKPKIFKYKAPGSAQVILPEAGKNQAMIYFNNGQKQLREFYLGSSFLSQSSQRFILNADLLERIEYQ